MVIVLDNIVYNIILTVLSIVALAFGLILTSVW